MRYLFIFIACMLLAACGGSGADKVDIGSTSTAAPATEEKDDIRKHPAPSSTFTISGVISIENGITVDDDVNDALATHCSYTRQFGEPQCNNNSPTRPQKLPKLATVMGFVSEKGTGTNLPNQRFKSQADLEDYYRVHLDAGDSLYLQVVDYINPQNKAEADLDLFASLYQGNRLSGTVYKSNKRGADGQFEYFTVAETGDYLIQVSAFSGTSKYVLKVLAADTKKEVEAPAQFIVGEMVVQTLPDNRKTHARSFKSHPFLQQHKTRPQLVKLPEVPKLRSLSEQSKSADVVAFLEQVNTLQMIKQVQLSGDVEFAEPNYIRKPHVIPNDELYALQWHYPAINLPQAWDITKGMSTQTLYGDVIVAVIDSGIYLKHDDLKSKLVSGYDFISSNISSRDGDGIDDNPDDPGDSDDPKASSWHGTHVAGTVAAATDNNIGVAGVSWGAKIMPLRVLGTEGGTSYDISQSIRYAIGLSNDSGKIPSKRADIINLSLGSTATSEAERLAIRAAIDAGVMVVAAAGNDNVITKNYPAAYPDVIAVSATRKDGAKAEYSNYGGYIRVAAPGGEMSETYSDGGIISTYVTGNINHLSGEDTRVSIYAASQGTSMATPHVAGVLALMKAINPALTQHDILNLLSQCEITNKKDACNHDIHFGYGRIDAYLAVQAAANTDAGKTSALLMPSISRLNLQTFNSSAAQKILTITNYGRAKATDIRLGYDANWLTVEAGDARVNSLDINKELQLLVTATPNNLAVGRYETELTVSYQTGTEQKNAVIKVALQVGIDAQISTFTQHYVVLEKVDCSANCLVQILAPRSGLKYDAPYAEYRFKDVSAGQYRIYVTSNTDQNNQICEYGETCGVYPGGKDVLTVDRHITGINITVRLFTSEEFETAQPRMAMPPVLQTKLRQ